MAALTAMAIGALALSGAASAKSLLSKTPKPPSPIGTLPEAPKQPDPGAEMSKQIMRARQKATNNASGRSSTILTGSRGVTDEPTTPRKTLLGM